MRDFLARKGDVDNIFSMNAWRTVVSERVRGWGVEVDRTSGLLAGCPLAVESATEAIFCSQGMRGRAKHIKIELESQ